MTDANRQRESDRRASTKSGFLRKISIKQDEAKESSLQKVTKTIVSSPHIYAPIGPYSQAILAEKMLYVSGIQGKDKEGQLVWGGTENETRQALENMKHVLEAGGASLPSVVKITILLADMKDFNTVNKVYADFFPRDFPARATFQVAKLPKNAAIEIECIALSGDLALAEADPCPCSK